MYAVAAPSGASVAVKSLKPKSGIQRFEYTPLDVGKRRAARCLTRRINTNYSTFLWLVLGTEPLS